MNRRRFLFATAALGGAVTIASVWKCCTPKALKRVERTAFALGANVAITAYHDDPAHANHAIEQAFAELEKVEQSMSIYRADSELSQLNANGLLKHPSRVFATVLRTAGEISAASRGAFDATIQPLWNAYAKAKSQNRLPTAEEINAARQFVDYQQVIVSDECIELQSANTRISLNGIAQGFALDRAKQILLENGIDHALIDTGEFGGVGCKPESEPWKVGVKHPREFELAEIVALDGRCLATSGDYATTFSATNEHHHLFDPQTGKSPTELASVSVLAPSGLLADAYSTALFVMGSGRGMQWLSTLKNVDAMFISKRGEIQMSNGFAAVAASTTS